ncbi:phosphoglucomutase/phosphomannomutase family protein [Tessaracoccus lacteus]|uniref:Phosphoglucomutase/phosphomannomutase family protein n=1 Tax=Tessaracoccus lacteus TaxID=3041766 RepID=A0ABY8PXS7_9ACTN|nr:phosphoglucomutase/phosphomannomutase family protein [Tessaracoccus sp. T21]WGT47310.1 phosphoglucomutase/phosphomannomutase family protein [Tessaracoccus sp. T21]
MIHFGTGGWREIIGDGFTRANVRRVVQALCTRMRAEGVVERGVVVGYDRRFLSKEAAEWAVEVFVGNGVPVTLIDRPAPTPMFMWTVRDKGCAYGLAVTASHNPALYNGLKIFTEGGRDAEVEITNELADAANQLADEDIMAVEDVRANPLTTLQTSMNWYIDSIMDQLDLEAIRHRHLNIVLDPMFGVSQTCLQTILMTARCQVDVINARHDALFGGRLPSPNAHTLDSLRQAVMESGADLGIATDGDADRLGIIDDLGNFLHPNQILVLLYHYLISSKGWKGPAVRNMSTTHMLDRVAEAHGQVCYEVPVGFKWISAKMAETDAVIGGESSGGLTVRGHIPGKDGVQAGSLLVEMVARSGKKLSELWGEMVQLYGQAEMVEDAYSFNASRRQALTQKIFVEHDLPEFPADVERIGWDDGCKVYFANGGWATIRFSGTEPVLRVFCEMPTLEAAAEISALIATHYGLGA